MIIKDKKKQPRKKIEKRDFQFYVTSNGNVLMHDTDRDQIHLALYKENRFSYARKHGKLHDIEKARELIDTLPGIYGTESDLEGAIKFSKKVREWTMESQARRKARC